MVEMVLHPRAFKIGWSEGFMVTKVRPGNSISIEFSLFLRVRISKSEAISDIKMKLMCRKGFRML